MSQNTQNKDLHRSGRCARTGVTCLLLPAAAAFVITTVSAFLLAIEPLRAQPGDPAAIDPIPARVFLEVEARLGADDLTELALEQFAPVFDSVSADAEQRSGADLTGRLELWRYGNVPGAGWICIADIALELYTPDGQLIFREVGRGCGGTKLRKGLYEAALGDLVQQLVSGSAVREFLETGATTSPPSSPRPQRLDGTFEVATGVWGNNVTWDVALDPTAPRSAMVMVSDGRRRTRSLRQISIRGNTVEMIENPPGLPLGEPVELSGTADVGISARIENQQYDFDGSEWLQVKGFAPCYGSRTLASRGYCAAVVRGSVVDSPRRWRVEVIGGSGMGAVAVLPLPLLYRAPKLVVAGGAFESAPFFVVLDRDTTIDFSPGFGEFGAQPGWQYVPWYIGADSAGNAYVLAKTSRPRELRFAKIDFPALTEQHEALDPVAETDDDIDLDEFIESGSTFDVSTIPIGDSCMTCSSALAVDPDSGTALILSREQRDTWYATFIGADGEPKTEALPDMVWPLDVLPGGDDEFHVLGFLPLALANVPGRLGIYSIAPDRPIRHEVTLTTQSWALLPPLGFERDPHTGSILTVWREGREDLRAAWYDPR